VVEAYLPVVVVEGIGLNCCSFFLLVWFGFTLWRLSRLTVIDTMSKGICLKVENQYGK
jgi:hypothetical protein